MEAGVFRNISYAFLCKAVYRRGNNSDILTFLLTIFSIILDPNNSMKKIFLPAIATTVGLAFTSCLGSDGDSYNRGTLTYGGSSCVNYVTDLQTGEAFVSVNPQYTFEQNYTALTSKPSMSNIRLASNGGGLAFSLPELPVKTNVDGYSYISSGTDLVPEGAAQSYLFDRFSLKYAERLITTQATQYIVSPVYDISYTINNRYSVVVYPLSYDMLGTTTVVSDKETYTCTTSIYNIRLDYTTGKAAITLRDTQLGSSDGLVDFGVKEVPFTLDNYGVAISTPEDTKYQVVGHYGDIQNCYMSNIKMRINVPSGDNSTLSFRADLVGVNGEETSTPYDITCAMSYNGPSK